MTALAVFVLMGLQERVEKMDRCVECHEDIPEDWKLSVHAKYSIGCIDCHGAETLIPVPKGDNPHTKEFKDRRKNVFSLCGKCHGTEVEEFRGGAHGKAGPPPEGMTKIKNCLKCHENHKTEIATFAAIRKECIECHKEGTREHASVTVFESGILRAKAEADALENDLKAFLSGPGMSGRRAREEWDNARSNVKWLRQTQHRVKLDDFSREAGRAEAGAAGARRDLHGQEESRRRRPLWLLLFLGVMLLNLVLVRRWCARRFGGH